MVFLKKASKTKSFGVEDYNNEQKEFFIGLGFTERIVKDFNGDVMYKGLSYRGTGIFGFWSKEEVKSISKATRDMFGSFKVRTLTIAELM
tara:strand:- start:108 stop:377 length:270 start_codon:yes stop_codon:yes gene_type:complete